MYTFTAHSYQTLNRIDGLIMSTVGVSLTEPYTVLFARPTLPTWDTPSGHVTGRPAHPYMAINIITGTVASRN